MTSHQRGTILLTGANGGLGSAIVSHIVSSTDLRAHHGIFTVRSAGSAPALQAALNSSLPVAESSGDHELILLDLSQLRNVREVTATINARVKAGSIPPIRAIILNAGVEEFGTQTWADNGLDISFMVNYLGHWLLTLLLLQSMDKDRGRVVWISSWAQNPLDSHNVMNGSFNEARHQTMITDSLDPLANGTWSANKEDTTRWAAGYRRYGASKMCGVAMINELQARLDQDPLLHRISVVAVDPGLMSTGITRHSPLLLRILVFQLLGGVLARIWGRLFPNGTWRTPEKSARDVLAAALASGPPPLTEHPKGLYLNGSEAGDYNVEAKDSAKGKIIWDGSRRFANLKSGDTILRNWL
ncbi:NAD(P)-binding protein [Xylariaceae sp. FL0804]|nr:NAD(P)-binding protein [Xylariaceae sp. FL0804]